MLEELVVDEAAWLRPVAWSIALELVSELGNNVSGDDALADVVGNYAGLVTVLCEVGKCGIGPGAEVAIDMALVSH